jgi:protocatechuate 3,4-dioxygenase beta subunit
MSRIRNSSPGREARAGGRPDVPAAGHLFLALALALALAPAVAAQVVTGRVSAPEIAAMDTVRVELRALSTPFEKVRTWAPGQDESAPLTVTRPLPDGGFRLLAPAPGMYRVVVRAPGRVPMQYILSPLLDDLELAAVELPVEGATRVRVVGPEGSPIAGARLRVRWGRGAVWAGEVDRWRPVRLPALTDDAGLAAVPIAVGEEEVVVEGGAPGWLGASVRGATAGTLELVLAPGVVRRVEVRREGRPLAGAALWVTARDRPAVITDDAGVAPVTLPDGEAVEIRVETADGWRGRYRVRVGAAAEGAQAAPPLRLTLQPPALLAGRVVDAEGGEPLAGALVWLGGEEGSAVVSAADGRFAVPVAGPAAVEVNAAAPGFERQHLKLEVAEWPRAGDGLLLPLTPRGVVSGTVLDPAGRPVPGATVLARQGWRREAGWSWDPGDSAVAVVEVDADGRFRIDDLPSHGTLWLRAEAADRPLVEVGRPVGDTGVRLVLGHGGALRARVQTADGGVVAGAPARLFATTSGNEPVEYEDGVRLGGLPVALAEDGVLRLERVPTGTHELVVEVPGHQRLTVPGIEVAEGAETDLGTLELRPEVLLAGRVVDAEGRPIAGARLGVFEHVVGPTSTLGSRGRQVEADEEGRFLIDGLGDDLPLTLTVRADGYLGVAVDLELPHQEPLEVRLGRGGTVFGEVVDEGGQPVAGASLRARIDPQRHMQHRPPSGGEVATASSDDDGRFELIAVPAGVVAIDVSSRGGRGSIEAPAGTVGEGERVGPLRIEVPSALEIAGRVVRADGMPAARASVAALQQMPGGGSSSFSTTADALGRFRLPGQQPGPVTVVATLGVVGRAEREVTVTGGVSEIELVLEPTTAVSGRVVAADGSPAGRGHATLEREGDSHGVVVDELGRFEIVGLEEGTYRLLAEVPGVGRGAHPEPVEVRLGQPVEGLVVRLAEGARVVGRVTGVAATDLAQVELSAFLESGGFNQRGLVRADGSFEIRGLAAGRHTLQAWVRSTGQAERATFEVEEGALLDGIELDFSGSTLIVTASVLGQTLDERPLLVGGGSGKMGTGRRLGAGRFAFAGLEPGLYDVSIPASAAGPRHSRRLEVAGDQEVVLALEGWPVAGTALGEDGQPVPGVVVWVVEPGVEVPRWGPGLPGLPPDAAGRFELPAVPPGTWRLVAGGGPWWGEALVEVPPGGAAGVALTVRRRAEEEGSALP